MIKSIKIIMRQDKESLLRLLLSFHQLFQGVQGALVPAETGKKIKEDPPAPRQSWK